MLTIDGTLTFAGKQIAEARAHSKVEAKRQVRYMPNAAVPRYAIMVLFMCVIQYSSMVSQSQVSSLITSLQCAALHN